MVNRATQRPNQQHGCSCGAHEARQDRANQQNASVKYWRANQSALEPNATANCKKSEEENNERKVFKQQDMQKLENRKLKAKKNCEWDKKS